jgi:hypothetical protein
VEEAAQPSTINGYYITAAQSLIYCASHGTTVCQGAHLSKVPWDVAAVMTNPVALLMKDSSTGAGYLAASDESGYALQTFISEATGQLSLISSTSKATLWTDPACQTQIFLEETGSFAKQEGLTSTTGLPISGTLSLTLQMVRTFTGDCTSTLAELQACYSSAAACGGTSESENEALHQSVAGLFAPYIEAGAMSTGDIPTLTSLAYEVSYQ